MPTQAMFIEGKFPGMNEIIGAARKSRFGSASMKKKWTRIASNAARAHMIKVTRPVTIDCVWIEGNRRRDLDNVAAGSKFVLDGLVDAGILPDDSQKWVKSIFHQIRTSSDKKYGVRISITTLEDS